MIFLLITISFLLYIIFCLYHDMKFWEETSKLEDDNLRKERIRRYDSLHSLPKK